MRAFPVRLWSLTALLAFPLGYVTGFAATPVEKQREWARQVEALPTEKRASAFLAVLDQTYRCARAQEKDASARRAWEELLNDFQVNVASVEDEAYQAILVKSLPQMPPALQALLLVALKKHPPGIELDRAAHELVKSTQSFPVRIAATDLLAAHGYREAADDLIHLIARDRHTSTRIAACRALATLDGRQAIEPLIEILNTEPRGRLRYEAVAVLRTLTSEPFGADGPTWANWWQKNQAAFVPPPGTAPAFNWEVKHRDPKELEYYDIPLIESRVIFIMDVSGSMSYGGNPCRLDKARAELKGLIGRLDPRILFNVIVFSGNVTRWSKAPLVPASPEQKASALKFLDNARVGGATQTIAAIEEALWDCAARDGVETIFLLTDGAPTPMRHHDVHNMDQLPASNEAIRRRICFINQLLKVRIHTIGVYTRDPKDPEEQSQLSMKDFLTGVADDNDGVYREVK